MTEQWLLHQPPTQARGDGIDGAMGSGAVEARADIEGEGQTLGFLKAGVVAAVEEILQSTTHVTEVFSGAEDNGITGQNIFRAGFQRREHRDLDIFDVFVLCALLYGLPQFEGIRRGCMGDYQQFLFRIHTTSPIVRESTSELKEAHHSHLQLPLRLRLRLSWPALASVCHALLLQPHWQFPGFLPGICRH